MNKGLNEGSKSIHIECCSELYIFQRIRNQIGERKAKKKKKLHDYKAHLIITKEIEFLNMIACQL